MAGVIWCPPPSRSALLLARRLEWRKLRDSGRLIRLAGNRSFGQTSPLLLLYPPPSEGGPISAPLILNSKMCWDKLTQHHVLRGAGIPTLDVLSYAPDEGWVPRTRHHAGGGDFLQVVEPDYFTRRVSVEKEFRFHIIGGKSVKAGGKIPLPGAHEWVRSRQFGWVVDYGPRGRDGIAPPMREMAKEAAAALQMDAGVVDVWKLDDGRAIVGEVNVRPGMDEPTIEAWATALKEISE